MSDNFTLEITPAQRFAETIIAAAALSRSVDRILLDDQILGMRAETATHVERHLDQIEAELASYEGKVKSLALTYPPPRNRNDAVERLFNDHKDGFVEALSKCEARLRDLKKAVELDEQQQQQQQQQEQDKRHGRGGTLSPPGGDRRSPEPVAPADSRKGPAAQN